MSVVLDRLTIESEFGCILDGAGLLSDGSYRSCNSVEKYSRSHILSNVISIVLAIDGLGEYTLYARRMTFRVTASKGQRLEVDFLR
jgi:hypothetical protein